ncbi:MAG TPA: hypothetical protein VFH04_00590 [Nitrososphaeraceae archaeon]|nr:hypothetical protein [Nitrososphaeraceae archaeon]
MIPNKNPESHFPFTVVITSTRGGNIASKLRGYLLISRKKFYFSALAYGRIGGHNISLNLTKKTLNEVKKMGLDGEIFSLSLQRKLIEGDVILKTNRLAINRDLSDG